jgi:hypothetical protein
MNLWISAAMCDQEDALSTVGKKGLTADIAARCDSALLPGTVLATFTASVLHHIPVKKLPAYYGTVHNSQPLIPIVSHMNPVHTQPSYFFTLHFNIIRYAQSKRSFLQQLQCKRMSWR